MGKKKATSTAKAVVNRSGQNMARGDKVAVAKAQKKGYSKTNVPQAAGGFAKGGKVAKTAKVVVNHLVDWTLVTDDEFKPVVSNDALIHGVDLYMGFDVEVSGNFHIKDGVIDYVSRAASSSSTAGVKSKPEHQKELRDLDRERGYRCNGQWHTHPGFSAYYSPTDDKDQAQDLGLALKFGASSIDRYYLVIDELTWLMRHFYIEDGKRLYTQTHVRTEGGTVLNGHGTKYSHSVGNDSWAMTGRDDWWKKGIEDPDFGKAMVYDRMTNSWIPYEREPLANDAIVVPNKDPLDEAIANMEILGALMHEDDTYVIHMDEDEYNNAYDIVTTVFGGVDLAELRRVMGAPSILSAVNKLFYDLDTDLAFYILEHPVAWEFIHEF